MVTFLSSCSSEEASFMKNGVEDMSTGVLERIKMPKRGVNWAKSKILCSN